VHNSLNAFIDRDEAIQMSGMPTTKNSIEMENHVFQKAKSKVCLSCYLKNLEHIMILYISFILFYPHISVKLNYIVNY